MSQPATDPADVTSEPIEFEAVSRADSDTFNHRVQTNGSSQYVNLPKESRLLPGIEPGDSVAIKLSEDGVLIVPDGGDE